jgi:hypothetical protein
MCMAAYDKVEGGLEPGSHRVGVELEEELAWYDRVVAVMSRLPYWHGVWGLRSLSMVGKDVLYF